MINNKDIYNVLVFPGGTENGLEIWRSLKDIKMLRLFACTSDSINHAEYVFNKVNTIKSVFEDGWHEDLNEVLKMYSIDFIYPANSFVIDKLIEYRGRIVVPIILPCNEIVEITRSKKMTYTVLKDFSFIPLQYNTIDEIDSYPVFVKPDKGYGGQGARMVYLRDINEIDFNTHTIQEFLPGEEFTVDCFSNSNGDLLFIRGRKRERVRMGTSMHAELVCDLLNTEFVDIAEKILSQIKITGAWFFQVKRDKNNQLKLLEIDIRIAGTMALNRVCGVNFPLLTIYDFIGINVKVLVNNYNVVIDRCLMNRYKHNVDYDTVYIDLDDTLIIKNSINTDLIKFLYQCINKKIKVILLTKSLEKNLSEFLKKFRIHDIFDEIIHISEDVSKADYINNKKSIFIDDSFSQRMEVASKCDIFTFDNSMIEMLMDDRI